MKVQAEGDQSGCQRRGDTEPRPRAARPSLAREVPQAKELSDEEKFRCGGLAQREIILNICAIHVRDVTITP
jgi:hypothetical protein